MTRWLAALLALLLWCGIASAGATEASQDEVRDKITRQLGSSNSYALVLGISTYDQGWSQLPGTAAEAAEISEVLGRHGFTIVSPVTDGRLTIAELRRTIAEFLRGHGGSAENRLIIYVASHGAAALKDGTSMGFLVASDTPRTSDPGFAAGAYSVNELADALLGTASQHIYLFFNACFSGAMVPDVTRGSGPADEFPPAKAPPLSPEVAGWTLELLAHNARLVLTAGSDGQQVPDRNNPYAKSIVRGLMGEADSDGDGLILGTELAQFVRGYVARETRLQQAANDPVFAILPKVTAPPAPRPDAPESDIDYRLQGDFVFLSPIGAHALAGDVNITAERNDQLPPGQFTDCPDCPVMVGIPGEGFALAKTETTLTQWDACYRELGCRRWIDDQGLGRGDRPAQGIDWADAQEFVQWLNRKRPLHCSAYRLPTSEEWRMAALADSHSAFPWGDSMLPGKAVCWGCGDRMTGWTPERTASHPGNAFGLHDMIGNLWEWVDDGTGSCRLADLLASGRCAAPGTVMGGAFSSSGLDGIPSGSFPRGIGLALPTIGLRTACVLQ